MTAKINLRTGKIIGAEKGTFAFYHEKGHLVYDNSDRGITNGVYQNTALYGALMSFVFAYAFDVFKILAGIFVFIVVGLAIFEEAWCNIYAHDILEKKSKIMKGGQKQK